MKAAANNAGGFTPFTERLVRPVTTESLDAGLGRNDREAEQATLGAMMLAAGAAGHVAGDIIALLGGEGGGDAGQQHFAHPAHRTIYQAILQLRAQQRSHGPIEIMGHLDGAEINRIGGMPYLGVCQDRCTNVLSGTAYARQVLNAAALRSIAKAGTTAVQRAGSVALDEARDVLEQIRGQLDGIHVDGPATNMVGWDPTAADAVREMERLQAVAESPDAAGEFSTGWRDLDDLIGTPPPGTSIVIAGRPGLGKSVAGRNLLQHLTMRKLLPGALFSLEMTRLEIAMALLSAGAKIPLNDIRGGTMHDDQWGALARHLKKIQQAPLYIDDSPYADLNHVDRELTRLAREHERPVAAYVYDYLQLGNERGHDGRQQEISAMSRGHKLMAKEHQTVSVALSQLNRGPEQRSDKRPLLSDLRESGSIEQNADIVILLHREDYYDQESPRAGEVDFIVAKNRNGPTGTVTLASQLHLARFVDFAMPTVTANEGV